MKSLKQRPRESERTKRSDIKDVALISMCVCICVNAYMANTAYFTVRTWHMNEK